MPRVAIAVALFAAVVLACGDDGDTGPEATAPLSNNDSTATLVKPGLRPPGVPDAAQDVQETIRLGRFVHSANEPSEGIETRQLEVTSCDDGLITLETSAETIYATLPCDSFLGPETEGAFVGKEVAIVLDLTGQAPRIVIDTIAQAHAEFPVGGIWIE